MKNENKKCAFTLAEVLITLAIIGVVAALTIPTVVRNYQKMQLKTALKKQWSVMSQMLNQTAFDLGGINNTNCYYGRGIAESLEGCTQFFEEYFMKNFKVIKTCSSNAIENKCQPKYKKYYTNCPGWTEANMPNEKTYVLADGTIIILFSRDSDGLPHPFFAVDVNGLKEPNKSGYDLFAFTITNDGKKLSFKDYLYDCLPADDPTQLKFYSQIDKW